MQGFCVLFYISIYKYGEKICRNIIDKRYPTSPNPNTIQNEKNSIKYIPLEIVR
jgi:hypothetical protein